MNNKGFAITTILYGTFLLFMLLLLTMLGILGDYKHKMDILVDNTNGARDIVDVYDAGSYLMKIAGRKYYKATDGSAVIAYIYDGNYTGPLLISDNKEDVYYYTDCKDGACTTQEECKIKEILVNNKKVNEYVCIPKDQEVSSIVSKTGVKYYYSSSNLWMNGKINIDTHANSNNKFNWDFVDASSKANGLTVKDHIKSFVDNKILYYE